jgi:hypothetical protein
MTREDIEQRMDELARKFVETRDPEIIEKLYNLRFELKRLNSRLELGQRRAKH